MIQMLIEAAAGSCDKNYYDEQTREYQRTRRVARPYPYPYGFILGPRTEDGDCVDCYLITRDPVTPGAVVACEPVGLLLVDENGEVDHKILAARPGQEVAPGEELLRELQEFIAAIWAANPDMRIGVGPILPRQAALQYLEESGPEK